MTTQPSNEPLLRSTPEAQGVSSSAILAFVEEAERSLDALHSFMLLRHGQVVAEGWWNPYAPDRPHMLFSLSKSFTSTAAGLAISEGRFSLDDTVLYFFPEEAPSEVSENLAAMRVRHLLSMSTGHSEESLAVLRGRSEENWVRAFLARPVEHEPGTHFVYNSGATYMVSAIVQKTTGQKVVDYLQPRLFEPLGITGAAWETCPRGINTGGWGLSVKTEDIARFGQLYLQKGVWDGRRLVPEEWIGQATSKQIDNGDDANSDWCQGYGFQFWRCRHNAYRGDGAFGQYCVVMPDQDAVLAVTSGLGDMQAVLNLVWERLLPACGPEPLPADTTAQDALCRKLAGLVLRAPEGESSAPVAAEVSGRTYRFEANEPGIDAVTFDFGGKEPVVRVTNRHGEHRLAVGCAGAWEKGVTEFQGPARPVAASGAWTARDTYTLKLCFFETPFCMTYTCQFAGEKVEVEARMNVSFGPTEGPKLVGKASA